MAMEIPLPRGRRPIYAAFGGVLFGVLVAGAAPQVTNLWDRPSCGETVMKAVSTEKPVNGAYNCFDDNLRQGLNTAGIDSDNAFANRVGKNGSYHYLHKTEDGGYVYEYDRPQLPHNKMQGAISALKRRDLVAAWNEITGESQHSTSRVYTLYFDGNGKVSAVL
jgi:hypothetical protein